MLGVAHRRPRYLLAAVGACAITASFAPASTAAACPGARAHVAKAPAHKLRSALLCLVNRRRTAEGLKPLRLDRKLQRAAGRHARDMVRHDYFAHQRDGGPDLSERLDRAGWSGRAWGETLAYGCGSSGSPKATLRGWLKSPPHRAVVLSGSYRRGGLGVGGEAPCGADGAIWVLDVGRR
jgi:uncharacterized protein YkwD